MTLWMYVFMHRSHLRTKDFVQQILLHCGSDAACFISLLRFREPTTAACWARHRLQRTATSGTLSSNTLYVKWLEDPRSSTGEKRSDWTSRGAALFWMQSANLWRVSACFRGYLVRWRAVDHCVRQFLHITAKRPHRQAGSVVPVSLGTVDGSSSLCFIISSSVAADCVARRRLRLPVFPPPCRRSSGQNRHVRGGFPWSCTAQSCSGCF